MQEPSGLGIVADVASLASLAGTVAVWFQTRSIKRSVLRSARVPGALRDIQRLSDELRTSLKNWPAQELESIGLLAQIDAVLGSVIPKLVGAERRKLQQSKAIIRKREVFLPWMATKEGSLAPRSILGDLRVLAGVG